MALYIDDKHIIDLALTEEGLNLIYEKVKSFDPTKEVEVKWLIDVEKGTKSFTHSNTVVLIQTIIGDKNDDRYSNIVGISNKQIYINPINRIDAIGNPDWDAIHELKTFIETDMVTIIRNNKINQLLR